VRPSGAFLSVDAADLDGDGRVDIVGGGGNAAVYAYDGSTGAQKWQSLQIQGGTPAGLAIADFDGDGQLEVAAQTDGSGVYVLDGRTHAVEAVIQASTSSLATVAADGPPRLLLGGTNGHADLYGFDGASYQVIRDQVLGTASIDSTLVAAADDWWVGSAGVVTRWRQGAAAAVTTGYGNGFGKTVALLPTRKMVFSGGAYGVFGFPSKP